MSETAPAIATPTPRKLRRWALAVLAIPFVTSLHWLLFQGQQIAPGVIVRPLGPCDVDWYEQRGGAIVIACPYTDLIRLWPLPIEQPWWEHSPYNEVTAQAY